MSELSFLIAILIFIIVFWITPIMMIIKNQETSKKEKALWIFAAFFVSWFAFILFVFIAPVLPNDDDRFRSA
jgi:hypothetical protein